MGVQMLAFNLKKKFEDVVLDIIQNGDPEQVREFTKIMQLSKCATRKRAKMRILATKYKAL